MRTSLTRAADHHAASVTQHDLVVMMPDREDRDNRVLWRVRSIVVPCPAAPVMGSHKPSCAAKTFSVTLWRNSSRREIEELLFRDRRFAAVRLRILGFERRLGVAPRPPRSPRPISRAPLPRAQIGVAQFGATSSCRRIDIEITWSSPSSLMRARQPELRRRKRAPFIVDGNRIALAVAGGKQHVVRIGAVATRSAGRPRPPPSNFIRSCRWADMPKSAERCADVPLASRTSRSNRPSYPRSGRGMTVEIVSPSAIGRD